MRKNYILFSAKGAKKVVLNIVGWGHVPLGPPSPLDPQLQSQFVEIPRGHFMSEVLNRKALPNNNGVFIIKYM